jgi:hypothetical protein
VIPPIVLRLGAYGLILGAAYVGGCVRGSQTANQELATYRANVEAEGRSAQAAADARRKLDEQRKAASDESYAKALGVLGHDLGELRKRATARGDFVPAKPADSVCPQGWACFDRAALESAIRQLDAGVSGIVAEGDQVRLRMDESIKWANRLNP